MALTRKLLKTMDIDEAKIDEIIEAHSETVTALKEEIEKSKGYKADAEKLKEVEKELAEIKSAAEADAEKNPWKIKYEALREEVDEKEKAEKVEATKRAKTEAYKKLLKETGVSEKRIDTVAKVMDIDKIELDEDGKIKDAEALTSAIREEWSDFITTAGTQGAQTPKPPAGAGRTAMTRDEIMAIKDDSARQKAIVENGSLFGIATTTE